MDVREILDKHHIEYNFSVKDYIVKCLSPEHKDNTPSCNIDKISGVFQCWSCGYSGDIYSYFNLNVPNQVNNKVQKLLDKIKKLSWSTPLMLPLDAVSVDWDFRDISASTLKHFEAFTSDDTSIKMEGRMIFPLRDIHGDIKMYLGRHMYSDIDPKYKIYPEHTEVPLYPEVPPITEGSIILVEGIFDLLNLYDKGLKNVILCGGVHLGLVKKKAKQQRNLDRLLPYKYQGIHTLHILFDGDKAGRDAAVGFKKYAGEEFNVQIYDLEDGKDPGILTQKEVDIIKDNLYG